VVAAAQDRDVRFDRQLDDGGVPGGQENNRYLQTRGITGIDYICEERHKVDELRGYIGAIR
jgi:hypothetical protein